MNRLIKQIVTYLAISIILFYCVGHSSSQTDNELLITQYIYACESNQVNSVIYKFNVSSGYTYELSPNDTEFFKTSTNEHLIEVQLKKPLPNEMFSFTILLEKTMSQSSQIKMSVNGELKKSCENGYTAMCTVIIAFLASLCLIIFTALALTLIILRRKKPITFNFGQHSDRENNDRVTFNLPNDNEGNLDNSSKQSSFELSNGLINQTNNSNENYPRKSSLKPPKTYEGNSEQNGNNNNKKTTSRANPYYENTAYVGNELSKVEEEHEDKPIGLSAEYLETKRKSIVTFSDTTDIYK